MPIYEYACKVCGHKFDTIQSFSEEPLIDCPVCKEPALKKLVSASAFHLKGSGWYVTDFKNPSVKADSTEKNKAENASKRIKKSIKLQKQMPKTPSPQNPWIKPVKPINRAKSPLKFKLLLCKEHIIVIN